MKNGRMERTSTRFIPFLRKSHFAGAPISLNNLDLDLKPFHFPAPDNVFQSEPGDADSLYHLEERVRQHHPLVIHHLCKSDVSFDTHSGVTLSPWMVLRAITTVDTSTKDIAM